jgi:signal transduction histidine kinase
MDELELSMLLDSEKVFTTHWTADEVGSGFGFNNSQNIIALQWGDFYVKSSKWKWTTIIFTIPLWKKLDN